MCAHIMALIPEIICSRLQSVTESRVKKWVCLWLWHRVVEANSVSNTLQFCCRAFEPDQRVNSHSATGHLLATMPCHGTYCLNPAVTSSHLALVYNHRHKSSPCNASHLIIAQCKQRASRRSCRYEWMTCCVYIYIYAGMAYHACWTCNYLQIYQFCNFVHQIWRHLSGMWRI